MKTAALVLSVIFLSSCATSGGIRSNSKRQDLVNTARELIGSKYRYGGMKKSGFDCSGLTSFVYDQHHVQLPRTAAEQYRTGKKVARLDAEPGDLIFFIQKGRINHVGIVSYVKGADLKFVHSTSSAGVIEDSLRSSRYWSKRYKAIRRVL